MTAVVATMRKRPRHSITERDFFRSSLSTASASINHSSSTTGTSPSRLLALATREDEAKQEILEESFTSLNKVRFASVSLHGREKQLATLRECFFNHVGNNGNHHKDDEDEILIDEEGEEEGDSTTGGEMEEEEDNIGSRRERRRKGKRRGGRRRKGGIELVAIEGLSGMGKTRLAESLRNESVFKTDNKGGRALFVCGKHEIQNTPSTTATTTINNNNNPHHNIMQEPFEGVSQCCQEICQAILQLPEQSRKEAREEIKETFHAREIYYLAKIMPLILKVADLNDMDQSAKLSGGKQLQETRARFNYCLRRFLNLISSRIFPTLVLVLDDVQRCDMATLEFLKYLCSASSNWSENSIMIILTYRSNEVDDNHPLTKTLQEIDSASAAGDIMVPRNSLGESSGYSSINNSRQTRNSLNRSRSSMNRSSHTAVTIGGGNNNNNNKNNVRRSLSLSQRISASWNNRSGRRGTDLMAQQYDPPPPPLFSSVSSSMTFSKSSMSISGLQDHSNYTNGTSTTNKSGVSTVRSNAALHNHRRKNKVRFTTIEVDRLTQTDTLHILMELLGMDDEDDSILALAEVCHRRTSGNPFFIQAFVNMLKQEGLLYFHIGKLEWDYELEEIRHFATATGNVVEMIGDKMRHVGKDSNLGHLLVVAACLGASFDYSVLSLVWPDIVVCDPNGQPGGGCGCQVMSLLNIAVSEGFLDKAAAAATTNHGLNTSSNHHGGGGYGRGSGGPAGWSIGCLEQSQQQHQQQQTLATTAAPPLRFVWIHDTIQMAALSLMEEKELCNLKFKLGNLLLKHKEDINNNNINSDIGSNNEMRRPAENSSDEGMVDIFMIANLLNEACGSHTKNTKDAIRVAEVNREAAKIAVSISAFESALSYTQKGLELLQPLGNNNKWNDHRELALRLHSYAAELELYFGDLDSMKANCTEILNQPHLSISEKIPAYEVLMDHMTSTDRYREALDLSSNVLKKLGVRLPKGKTSQLMFAMKDVLKLRTKMKTLDVMEVAQMPFLTEGKSYDLVHMFARVGSAAFFAGERALLAYCVCQGTKIQLEHGLTDQKKGQIITIGMLIISMLGDVRSASKIAEDCLELTWAANARNNEAATMMMAYVFIFPWTKPIRSLLKPLLRGYSVGLEGGDVENAVWCIYIHLTCRFEAGANLDLLEADYDRYKTQMNGLHRNKTAHATRIGHSLLLYLLCEVEDPALHGDDLEQEDDLFMVAIKAYCRSRLYAIFGQFEQGAALAEKTHKIVKMAINGTPNEMFFTTSSGLCWWAVARKTKKSSDIRTARKYSKIINQWATKENPNVIHYNTLFSAEEAALRGKKEVAEQLYRKAFAIASRSGCIHEAALVSERHANFLLVDMKDKAAARGRLDDAQKLYYEWGASAKVAQLQKQMAKIDVVGEAFFHHPRSHRSSFLLLNPLSRLSSRSLSGSRWSLFSKQSE